MKLISYRKLARTRLAEFLDKTAELYVEKSGMEVVVGLGGFESFGELGATGTVFGWKQGEPYQTAEVSLELGADSVLPDASVKKLLKRLGLPIKKGMKASELIESFGKPLSNKKGRAKIRLLRFICGEKDKYYLMCVVDDREGLISISLARKDYCDENESL
jgi:hypothetical protein